jgi:hypothetical protein
LNIAPFRKLIFSTDSVSIDYKTNLQKHVSQNLGPRSAFPVLASGQVHHQTIELSPHKTIKILYHQTVKLPNHITIGPSDRQTIKLSNQQTISHQTAIIHKTIKPSSHQTLESSSNKIIKPSVPRRLFVTALQ